MAKPVNRIYRGWTIHPVINKEIPSYYVVPRLAKSFPSMQEARDAIDLRIDEKKEGKRGNPSTKRYTLSKRGSSYIVMDTHNTFKPGIKTFYDKEEATAYVKELNKSDKQTKSNPGAASIARGFHGRPVREVIDVTEEEMYSDDLAVLGILTELNILCDGGKNAIPIRFSTAKGNEVFVATPDGTSIEFVGGDQEVVNIERIAKHTDKQLVSLGKVDSIVYLADKKHLEGSTGKIEEYEHYLGKRTLKSMLSFEYLFGYGKDNDRDAPRRGLPELVQDTVNKKLLLVGGTYKVADVGIVD